MKMFVKLVLITNTKSFFSRKTGSIIKLYLIIVSALKFSPCDYNGAFELIFPF